MSDPNSHRSLDDASLAFLKGVDSPTIANAIEPFAVRDRCSGFIGGAVECQFPELGVMVGRALTVTMTSVPGPVASRDGYWRMWDALEAAPSPSVLVIADASGAPNRCAYAGEMMATLAQRLGAVGMVTDGALRDVDEVREIGFHYFMRYPVVSHGNFEIVSVGDPVVLDGERIESGDLLHGDRNGIVVIPDAVLDGLPEAVNGIREKEGAQLEFMHGDDFSLASLKQRSGY
ncbi:MAG: RraA family protein [Chloroflexota bacterium]|nr:RraA family protein [Chloroflexota bacterium]